MKKNRVILLTVILAVMVLWGCEFKKNVSREEIPFIKGSITAFETVLKGGSAGALDSLLSSEAAGEGMTSDSIMAFVFGDRRTEFIGFTEKAIFFRGDAARCDCAITGPDGPIMPVTITLKKENEVWLIKKIEPRVQSPSDDD